MGDWKTRKLEENLNANFIDIRGLKRQCWNGIPSQHRSLSWKILLGYASANTSRRSVTISKRRCEYHQRYVQYSTQALSNDPQYVRLLQTIQSDVLRTAPSIPIFRDERVQASLIRLLYVHACRHPATSYIQGLNDIVAPFLAVFLDGYYNGTEMSTQKDISFVPDEILGHIEADCYYCLGKFISGIQDHYTTDQPGIRFMILQLGKCLERVDPELHKHIVITCHLNILHFSFRWMACLLARELSLPCVVRIWDTYLCHHDDIDHQSFDSKGFDEYHVYVCAALLHFLRYKLLKMTSDEMMEFLTVRLKTFTTEELNPKDVDIWLSQAHVWQSKGVLDGTTFNDSYKKSLAATFGEKKGNSGCDSIKPGDCVVHVKNGDEQDKSVTRPECDLTQKFGDSIYDSPTTSMSDVDFLCY